MQEIEFANAYQFEDEPYWHELQTIFSPIDVEEQQILPVVVSSDDEDSIGTDNEDLVRSNVTD
ncbi:UNVERIFIED_CONTAM: hypothetical protein Slati_4295000 [Sesamum latifolium]|uniref:Uncharacterized protein n=1 Tax=Sesamum latifolium TaxID=2727402 RepID=A0AAW2TD37_9LAMI